MGPFGNMPRAIRTANVGEINQREQQGKGYDDDCTIEEARPRSRSARPGVHGGWRLRVHQDAGGRSFLQAFSAAQDIKLSYNEQGVLVDRGEPEGAQSILALLEKDWGYPVVAGDLTRMTRW